MLDGHFVWLWINTAAGLKYRNYTADTDPPPARDEKFDQREKRSAQISRRLPREDHFRNDISDMQFKSLLKNDHFLFFDAKNSHYRISSSSSSNSKATTGSSSFDSAVRWRRESVANVELADFSVTVNNNNNRSGEKIVLPHGLLSLRPLAIRVDRHLVKGAVRLLVATLERALANIPIWLVDNLQRSQFATSCWKASGASERNFSIFLAR